MLLLVGFAILWVSRQAGVSRGGLTGLGFGAALATLWTSPVLASALQRWASPESENPGLSSVRLPLAYWIVEYFAVLIVCAGIGIFAESWRAGSLVFIVLPFGLVFPPFFRAWIGPQVIRSRMRSFVGDLRARPGIEDISSLQAWAEEVSPKYGLKAVPAVIAVSGGRSLATYAVPAESAILLAEDHLKMMSESERMALTAHELAHIVRNEGRRRVAAEALVTLWYFGLFAWWLTKHPAASFSSRFVWLLVYSYVMQPVRAKLMRRREFAADRLAAQMLGDPSSLISALKKMAAARKSPDRQSRTHPTFSARIAALEESR